MHYTDQTLLQANAMNTLRQVPAMPTAIHFAWQSLLIASAYYLLAILGQVYVIGNTGISPFWPSAGLSLGLVLLLGYRALPGIFLGAFVAALESYSASGVSDGMHLAVSAVIIAMVIVIQAVCGRYLLRRVIVDNSPLQNFTSTLCFLLATPIIALVSATLGLTLLNLIPDFSYYQWSEYMRLWRIWWFADIVGLMVITPIVLLVDKQNYTSERNRFIFLTMMLCLILLVVTSATLTLLYRNYLKGHEQRLFQIVESQASIINAIARFDSGHNNDSSTNWQQATLEQVSDAYAHLPGFGETGEFVVGRNANGFIQIVLATRFGNEQQSQIALDANNLAAEPMRRALRGESGTLRGLDYRGKKVLAAYTPIEEMDIGLVLKADMAEINRPFIETAQTSSVIAAILIAIAIILFARVSRPVINRLEQSNQQLSQLVSERTSELEAANEDIADQLIFQQALIDTIPSPLFYKDQNGKFIGVNRAFEEAFTLSAGDLAGHSTLDTRLTQHLGISGKYDVRQHHYLDQQALRGEQVAQQELRLKFADGRVHDVLYRIAGVKKKDGSPAGLVGVIIDISEQKGSARQLQQARNAAEQAKRAQAEFLACMSHEIRTPLNGIIGFIELLSREPLSSKQEKMLQLVAESGDILLNLVNDILDFSKIESGELELDYSEFSVAEMIDGLTDTMQPMADERGLQLIAQVDAQISKMLVGDYHRLRQILLNFTGNAIKFSEHGVVLVRAEVLSKDTQSLALRLSVKDEGIGISEAQQARLFQPFTQAEASTATHYGGTGLGLAISRQLCELMGGRIGVTSREGEGAIFFVTLTLQYGDESVLHEAITAENILVHIVTPHPVEAEVCREFMQSASIPADILHPSQLDRPELAGCEAQRHIFILGLQLADGDRKKWLEAVAAESRWHCIELQHRNEWSEPAWSADRHLQVSGSPLKQAVLLDALAVVSGQRELQQTPGRAMSAAAGDPAQAGGNGLRLLVAEDNPVNQAIIRQQLLSLGYNCEIANNGADAIAHWQNHNYDLILTDCDMPRMDGYTLARNIRQLEQEQGSSQRIPIIAITANAIQGDADRCLAAGMDDYIAKPLKLEHLKHKLERWLDSAQLQPNAD